MEIIKAMATSSISHLFSYTKKVVRLILEHCMRTSSRIGLSEQDDSKAPDIVYQYIQLCNPLRRSQLPKELFKCKLCLHLPSVIKLGCILFSNIISR